MIFWFRDVRFYICDFHPGWPWKYLCSIMLRVAFNAYNHFIQSHNLWGFFLWNMRLTMVEKKFKHLGPIFQTLGFPCFSIQFDSWICFSEMNDFSSRFFYPDLKFSEVFFDIKTFSLDKRSEVDHTFYALAFQFWPVCSTTPCD